MKTETTTIAVVADIHFGRNSSLPKRRCDIADLLLMRTVRRLNKLIHPDVTLILGDLIDDGSAPDAEKNLLHIRSILDKLESPYIVIPGNHDDNTEAFYNVFERPNDIHDIAGIRFLPFVDQEMPGYNACRSDRDVERVCKARLGYDGPLVSLQHVCLRPESQSVTPYNYTNVNEIISSFKSAGVALSISGHHHSGAENTQDGDVLFVNAPGLCEAPFPFLEVTIEDGKIHTQRHELVMPKNLKLHDNHLHTQMAYCSENMTIPKAIEFARDFGLAGLTFTEHSGQLYFDRDSYWNNLWIDKGIDIAKDVNNRMDAYLKLKQTYENEFAHFSLEVDCDARGRLLLKPEDRKHFDFIIGAIHYLPGLTRERPPQQCDNDKFLFLVEAMCKQDIRILAHPFRVFSRSGWAAPPELFEPTAELLKKYQVAAEVNFHINEPPVEFIKKCLEYGVRISFGSDAHNLFELGDFAYHLALLKEAGFNGELSDIIIQD
jgi:histidinol phosphatase-like PHP family hydrolase/calcineurin-like phosphoesterase family protein